MKKVINALKCAGISTMGLIYTSRSVEPIFIKSSRDTFHSLKEFYSDNTIDLYESFYVLFLNRANRVIGVLPLSHGGANAAIVEPKFILAAAALSNASSVILAHNHPSGNLKPSQADISITKKIMDLLKLCDISLLDHLIVTRERYYSFADEGMI